MYVGVVLQNVCQNGHFLGTRMPKPPPKNFPGAFGAKAKISPCATHPPTTPRPPRGGGVGFGGGSQCPPTHLDRGVGTNKK